MKNAVSYINHFEDALAGEARKRGFDGVVCGHIHKAEIRDIGGILYCNDGDWVESLTALVELDSGELRIIDWKAIEALRQNAVNEGTVHGEPRAVEISRGTEIAHTSGD